MIILNNINKSYNEKTLFKSLSLTINTNEKILLKAPSGSGKTTLIKMLMGFEKPDSGQLTIQGQSLNKHTLKSVRESISYVSQDADLNLDTVKEVFDLIFAYKVNRYIDNYESLFQDYCQLFSLEEDIYLKEISSISGGERQRVALIIALILDRPILILDEITSGLDKDLKTTIKNHIMGLEKKQLLLSLMMKFGIRKTK